MKYWLKNKKKHTLIKDEIVLALGSTSKIPRIYSGVFYDACLLYGEPNYEASESSAGQLFTLLLADGVLSFGLDTVILPYTATRQFSEGSIFVNKRKFREDSTN
jgi:hypothetical protein